MSDSSAPASTHPSWERDGICLMENAISGGDLDRLQRWVSELEAEPGTTDGLLQYDEKTADGSMRRCRTENFVPFHEGLRTLLTAGDIPRIASELLGEQAVLYKEKLNYKAPQGAGFRPHQDAVAYPNVQQTLACMVAVDDASVTNGCLEIVRGAHHEQLPTDETGCIDPAIAATMSWEPLPVSAGSLLWFHCWVPHRSGANTTTATRRAIYLTYNRISDGDLRADYYSGKLAELRTQPERLSLIGHFAGQSSPSTEIRS
ncbi:phytanoyl-CoA dioxygenase family protein [Nocardia cerradoensis]|uniref:phytanoyl-CoA dioxygenase family protein n=1 Tax=Nocardia cerradoensis TaxID=85688 RepID=UPI0002E79202|nr:phytanoyl-CoA dioxygenase family protein [Nocardia cerradoensis]NKY41890.1 phytanoyl-CoA dioxygenase family protein [Nocardia cerradoensis]